MTRRIIPARAGFTFPLTTTSTCPTDHPRSRGVYDEHGDGLVGDTGSSPLARGLLGGPAATAIAGRIIPARAGFTCRQNTSGVQIKDHPRSRGVYRLRYVIISVMVGSSPLARGLPVTRIHLNVIGGIIPARAGFTLLTLRSILSRRDHPRSRGVYIANERLQVCESGSSPLARGLPLPRSVGRRPSRIIPARAGFTVIGSL